MVENDAVSKDFRKQVLGYGLTTAEIVYRRPDRHWLLQTYVWQDYDIFPNFPALKDFLAFWETKLEGPLFAVTVAHSRLIKPAELRAVDGVFRLHWRECAELWAELYRLCAIAVGKFTLFTRVNFSETTIPHFLPAGGDKVIE